MAIRLIQAMLTIQPWIDLFFWSISAFTIFLLIRFAWWSCKPIAFDIFQLISSVKNSKLDLEQRHASGKLVLLPYMSEYKQAEEMLRAIANNGNNNGAENITLAQKALIACIKLNSVSEKLREEAYKLAVK